jgi:hypothetical protein
MYNVYIRGVGYGFTLTGLGNTLFQIAVAIYYAEKYNMKIIIERNHITLFGTCNMFDRNKIYYDKQGNYNGYDYTILKNFTFTDNLDLSNTIDVENFFSNNKIIPENTHINILGFNQNLDLFKEYFHKIPDYLYLKDPSIIEYIHNKYGDVSGSICLGIRLGKDFENVKMPNAESYKKAIDYYKDKNINVDKIYVISDVPNIEECNFPLKKYYDYVEIVENDIVQIYFGLMCQNYVLSQSTFHLWIAYIASIQDKSKQTICFNNTDITNRNLHLDDWICIDY